MYARLFAVLAVLATALTVAATASAEPGYLLASGNRLIPFDAANPASLGAPVAVTGMTANDTLVAIDYRASKLHTGAAGTNNEQLWGLAKPAMAGLSRLYLINPVTGAATNGQPVTQPLTGAVNGGNGFDFDPQLVQGQESARITSDDQPNQNIRVPFSSDTTVGQSTEGAPLVGFNGLPNPFTDPDPDIAGIAYANNIKGSTASTLYDIDYDQDYLASQGSGAAADSGQLTRIGALNQDAQRVMGFDIGSSATARALAVWGPVTPSASSPPRLNAIDLTTGTATELGVLSGGGFNAASDQIYDLAILPNQSKFTLSPAKVTVVEGSPATFTITRVGDLSRTVSVQCKTTAGPTGANGATTSDYASAAVTVTFGPNQAAGTCSIPTTDDTEEEVDETFTVALGSESQASFVHPASPTATVTILDDDTTAAQTADTAYAVNERNELIVFSTGSPFTIEDSRPITGLATGEQIRGLDFRPATEQLYGIGCQPAASPSTACPTTKIYRIDPSTGAASAVGPVPGTPLAGQNFGFDIDPVDDRIQVTSENDESRRIHPDTGALAGQGTIAGAGRVVGLAFSNNFSGAPAAGTALFGIDSENDQLVRIDPYDRATGNGTAVDHGEGALGVNTDDRVGFDIASTTGSAMATLTEANAQVSRLYRINLDTGAAELVGTVGGDSPIRAFTLFPNQSRFFLSGTQATVGEGAKALLTITRSGDVSRAATVRYSTVDGTATAGSDYTAAAGTLVTFAPGQTQAPIEVSTVDDGAAEGNEAFTVTLTGPGERAVIGTPAATTVTIVDNDFGASTRFQSEAQTVSESDPSGQATITVVRSGDLNGQTTVNYATSDGPAPAATAGQDYASTSGTLTFAPGQTTQTFTVPIIDDAAGPEGDENVTITLTNQNPQGAGVGSPSQMHLTIIDNEGPQTVQFTSSTISVSESAGAATVTVTRSGPTTGTATVDFTTSPGPTDPATEGVDYLDATGTLTFAPGETSKTFSVPISNDAADEPNETVTITLANATGATAGTPATSTLTIVDDDVQAFVQFAAASSSVDEAGGSATITVTRSGDPTGTVTVDYATADAPTTPATAGSDYTATQGKLTFGPDETQKTFTVAIIDDPVDEPNERIRLTLSNPTAASLGGQSEATLVIADDDSPPVVAFTAGSIAVNEGDAAATLTVQRTGDPSGTSTVAVSTANGTATAGSDYNAVATTLTFAPGETTKQVSIGITQDTADEANTESFTVSLANASAGTTIGAPASATVVIVDDEGPAARQAELPTLTIRRPVAGGRFSAGRVGQLLANATAPAGIRRVTFFIGDRQICQAQRGPSYGCTFRPGFRDLGRQTLIVVATDTLGQETTRFRTVTVQRFKPRGLVSVVTPRRDATSPHVFVVKGRLRLPAGLSRVQGCNGKVVIRFSNASARTILRRQIPLSRGCTFRTVGRFVGNAFGRTGRVVVSTQFLGNSVLTAVTAPRVTVRAR